MATYQARVNPSGTTSHRYIVRRAGYKPRIFSALTKTEARRRARAYEAKIDHGEAEPEGTPAFTVADAFAFYEDSGAFRALKTAIGRQERRRQLEWWRARIGHLPLSDLVEVQQGIQDGQRELLKTGGRGGVPMAESSVNRYVAALGKAFRVAEQDAKLGSLLLYNPARKVERFSEVERNRTRLFTDREFRRLYVACRRQGRRLAAMYMVAMSSSARISEIEAMRVDRTDLQTGEIELYRTKNGQPRYALVSGIALRVLREYVAWNCPPPDGFLFAGPRGAPAASQKRWREARKRAGLLDTGWHTARHTSLTWYASLGASEQELREHGGHRSREALQGYLHNARRIRSAVAPHILPPPLALRTLRDEQMRAPVSPVG
jgi:integrase